jgi:hypothetical protein
MAKIMLNTLAGINEQLRTVYKSNPYPDDLGFLRNEASKVRGPRPMTYVSD